MKINTPIKEIESDNITFKLLKLEGNSKTQTISAVLTLKTSASNSSIYSTVKSVIDVDGNEYKLKSSQIGAAAFSKNIELNTEVPLKCVFAFEGILPSIKIIKLFKFEYRSRTAGTQAVEFRDLSIDWK